jgi:hypothetical protein
LIDTDTTSLSLKLLHKNAVSALSNYPLIGVGGIGYQDDNSKPKSNLSLVEAIG